MRVLGLDVGAVRVGVALSDEQAVLAQPLCTIKLDARIERVVERIGDLCAQHAVGKIVIGLPLSLSGGDRGSSAQRARRLGDLLTERLSLEIVYWDERFSTAEAQRVLQAGGLKRSKQRQTVDMIAASLILRSYFDSRSADDSTD